MENIDYSDLSREFITNHQMTELCIIKDNIDYYFKVNLKVNSKQAVVFSNGAADRKKSELPIFMRSTWAEEINSNTIFLDDRTIHDSRLMIGWGIGRKEVHYLKEIGIIVKKILECLGIQNEDTYYYGSSAGGMMSMMLAIKHKGSTAVVNNPQMIPNNYAEGKPLNFIRNNFFKEYSKDEFLDIFRDRISVPYVIINENYLPRTLYILNRMSEGDFKDQYLPFTKILTEAGIDTSNIQYLIYSNQKLGHNPLPKNRTINLINAILADTLL